MEDKDRIKIILQMLVAEIGKHLPDIEKIQKSGDESVKGNLYRSDLFYLVKACHEITNIEKFFGLTEVERIIKGSKINKKLTASVKRSLGFEGCFE